MFNWNKGLIDVGGIVDNVHTSSEESANISTERQRIDLSSPFKLPHFIRPYIAIGSWSIWAINIIWVLILASIEKSMDAFSVQLALYTLAATTANLGAVVSWYFHSRGVEKKTIIEAKANIVKSEAAIEIRKIEVKEEIRQTKAEERAEKKRIRQEKRGN